MLLELLSATAVCATLEVLVTTGNAPRGCEWHRQATELALLRSNFTSSWDSCSMPRHSAFRSWNSWSCKRREPITRSLQREDKVKLNELLQQPRMADWTLRFFQLRCTQLEWTTASTALISSFSDKAQRIKRGKNIMKFKGNYIEKNANTLTTNAKEAKKRELP